MYEIKKKQQYHGLIKQCCMKCHYYAFDSWKYQHYFVFIWFKSNFVVHCTLRAGNNFAKNIQLFLTKVISK